MIQLFNYGENAVRTLERDGEIWFVAKDVCDILGLVNARDAISSLDDDEKMTVANSDGHSGQRGGAQSFNVINEPGLYRLAFRSNKPGAKKFTKWVASEVLPTIRKTGSYGVVDKPLRSSVLKGARLIFEAAGLKGNQLALSLNKVAMKYTDVDLLALGEVDLEVPSKRQLLTPTEIGQQLGGLSARKVNSLLADAGLQIKLANGTWEPTKKGSPFAVMFDVGMRYEQDTPIRQLKWESSVVEVLRNDVCLFTR